MFVASIPSPEISAIELGPFRIHFYALCILAGILVAGIVTGKRLSARGGEAAATFDFVVWSVVFGIVGARVYHVFTHWGDFFYPGANLLDVFAIWQGGIAIFGALLGGALGVLLASKLTGIRFWSFADALVPGLLLAQAFGRLGNWFNQELFGEPTTLPWGLEISPANPAFPLNLPEDTLFHPTFIYEILWNLTGVFALLWLEKRLRPRWGQFFALYLIWYGIGRFWIEGLRLDPSITFVGLRINELTALAAVLLGIALYLLKRYQHPGKELSVYAPGRAKPGESVLAETSDAEKFYHVLTHPEETAAAAKETEAAAEVAEDSTDITNSADAAVPATAAQVTAASDKQE